MDTPSSSIGPGIGAFIAFFVLALALWLLMRNMNGRMRTIAYREQQRVTDLEAKAAASEPTPTTPTTPTRRKRPKRPTTAETGETADPEAGPAQAGRDEPTP